MHRHRHLILNHIRIQTRLDHIRALDLPTQTLDDDAGDLIRIGVTRRAAVLKVSFALLLHRAVDATARAAVGHPPREFVVRRRLVLARHARLVPLAVHLHMVDMSFLERMHGLLDSLDAAVLAHRRGRHIRMEPRAVPVAGDGLGMERDLDAVHLGDAVQQEPRQPELVAQSDPLARPHLVLPLRGHHLGVGAGDVDARVQTRLVVRVDHVARVDLARAVAAVVGALRGGEAVVRPAVRPAGLVQHGVFLFQAEPELVGCVFFHEDVGVVAEVVFVGAAVGHVGLAEDEDVGLAAEGVWEEGRGAQVDVGVVAGGLFGGRAIEVPFREVFYGGGFGTEGLGRCFCQFRWIVVYAAGVKVTRREGRCFSSDEVREEENSEQWLTLLFERVPLELSIQTYSAMTEPFWSSLRNLSSYHKESLGSASSEDKNRSFSDVQ